jgi:pyruvate dehydrogenase E1 component alpha subunit
VNFESSPIVAELVPVAVGHALAASQQQRDDIAVATFGEGAMNQGVVHESMNLAALWRLPVVFVCEDNGQALSVSKERSTSVADLTTRASGYGITPFHVPNNDPLLMYELAGEAVHRARSGQGPSLVVAETYRLHGGFEGDAQKYRKPGELDRLWADDPLPKFERLLLSQGALQERQADDTHQQARREVEEAVRFARESPYPALEEALTDVFVS